MPTRPWQSLVMLIRRPIASFSFLICCSCATAVFSALRDRNTEGQAMPPAGIENESKIQESPSVKRGSGDSMWSGKKSGLDSSCGAIESVGLLHRRAGDALEPRRSLDDSVARVALHRSARTRLGCACRVDSGRRVNPALALVGNRRAI